MRLFSCAFASVLVTSSVASAATLVHHYNFNTDNTVNDLVSVQSGALNGDASVSSGVLHLDGSGDYVQFGSHLIPASGQYTVALFARQLSLQNTHMEMISQGSSGGPGFYIGHNPSQIMRVTDSWITTGVAFPTDGQQHHYAMVVNASATNLYIDGIWKASAAAISTTAGGSHTRLGAQFAPYGEYFHGEIDDVRIYSGALSSLEVQAIAVPEPASLGILGGAVVMLGRRVRRK